MHPHRLLPLLVCTVACTAICASTAAVVATDPFETAVAKANQRLGEVLPGRVSLHARLRFEHFDTPATTRNGTSLRLRYGYTSPDLGPLAFMIEGESLWPLGSADQIHPLDQAGRGTELNQAWLRLQPDSTDSSTSIKLGRQVYSLDDHRFIGHVGWRQNIQSFDAVTASTATLKPFTVQAFHLRRVHRVTAQSERLDGWGLNLRRPLGTDFALTAFVYSLDFERQPAWSNTTAGLRLTGSHRNGELRLRGHASYAHQVDVGSAGARDFSLSYAAAELGATWQSVTVGAGFERLEGDGNEGFRTPLATVHAFHGFADVFLPLAGFPNGLLDRYVFAEWSVPGVQGLRARLIHHRMEPARGSQNYKRETDAVVTWRINRYVELIAKAGRYSPARNALPPGHLRKAMFTVEANLSLP